MFATFDSTLSSLNEDTFADRTEVLDNSPHILARDNNMAVSPTESRQTSSQSTSALLAPVDDEDPQVNFETQDTVMLDGRGQVGDGDIEGHS